MARALVLYHSLFGNTRAVANSLAKGIEGSGIEVDCLSIDEVDIYQVQNYDFLAVGGPTHNLGMSEPMKEFLEKLETIDISGKKGFCFDTRVQSRFNRFDLNSAAKRIEKKMKKMKVKMIRSRKSAIVEGREGPLEKGVQKTFEKLGKEIAELIQRAIGGDNSWD